jgi:hypothetical protein
MHTGEVLIFVHSFQHKMNLPDYVRGIVLERYRRQYAVQISREIDIRR